MNVVVTLEHRFDRTPDGAVWTQTMFAHRFWKRYLEVFDHVQVVARVRSIDTVPEAWMRADGDGVSFVAVPHYLGSGQFLRHVLEVRRVTCAAVGQDDAVILRVPSTIGSMLAPRLQRMNRPFGVEVVADPYDGFAPGAISHPLRPLFRWWFSRQLRSQCSQAYATSYVTRQALQCRYPPGTDRFTIQCSSVELPASAIVAKPRDGFPARRQVNLVTVGSLAHRHKGIDLLIGAMSTCVRAGHDLHLTVIGDGKLRSELEAQARHRGIADRVHFAGQLTSGAAVIAQLDAADLFILPSRHEGLPRAMIEAMARALPCIGSTAGGIPELLPAEDLVPAGDVSALSEKLREVVIDPDRRARMSARNLSKAKEYRDDVLVERRNSFFCHVREGTEAWLESRPRQHLRGRRLHEGRATVEEGRAWLG